MKNIIAFVLASLIASAAFADSITVAAAISLKDALAKVAAQYQSDTGQVVEFSFGSSGQLAGQIESGAPVDLFISAGNKQVDDLAKAGVVDKATRKVVAGNALVLIVPVDSKSPPNSLAALVDADVMRIAIGEPQSVPAGQYAQQAFAHAGVAEAVKDKLVFGTNVRQVLDYVERGEVSAGLVYATDAKVSGDNVRVTCTVDDAEHDPIVYPAVLVSTSKKQPAAGKFVEYLLSDKGQAKLREFGFAPPPQNSPGHAGGYLRPPSTQPTR